MRIILLVFSLVSVLVVSGCTGVKAAERFELGRYDIRADRDPLTETLAEHIYFTREASSGGRGVGGGGCGCN
jgi:hypothetical protein